jgi:hypothetical protein
MKTEWWYDDATYHYSDNRTLSLARLTVRDDGTAQILTDGGERIELENETEASGWLLDEEYRRLDGLIEDFKDEGLPVDPRIKPPSAASDEELVRQMVIELGPVDGAAAPGGSNALPLPAGEHSSDQNPTARD